MTFDERPVALRGASRPGRAMAPGQIAREDYEYVRKGTANVYCIVEPKAGRHLTHATRDRKAPALRRRLAADRASVPDGEDDSSRSWTT